MNRISRSVSENFLETSSSLNSSSKYMQPSSNSTQNLLLAAVRLQSAETVSFLISQGVDVNFQTLIGESALHFAADNSDLEIAEILLKNNANPNSKTFDGETPLHHSAFIGDKKMMKLLLKNGADPNCAEITLGRTPLHCAVQCEHLECVAILMSHGADPELKDLEGRSALNCSNPDILNLLQNSAESSHSLLYSASEPSSISFSLTESRPTAIITQKNGTEETSASFHEEYYEDPELVKFLRGIQMEEYKDLLILHGFDDFEMMVEQMGSEVKITHEVLKEVGIEKLGHRARILMRLEQSNGRVERVVGGIECCRASSGLGVGVNTLKDWLTMIRLERYQKIFERAGYEDPHFLVALMNSKHPLDENVLTEIGVSKVGHRMRILGKLISDARRNNEEVLQQNSNCKLL